MIAMIELDRWRDATALSHARHAEGALLRGRGAARQDGRKARESLGFQQRERLVKAV
jgi:hypothetical protein